MQVDTYYHTSLLLPCRYVVGEELLGREYVLHTTPSSITCPGGAGRLGNFHLPGARLSVSVLRANSSNFTSWQKAAAFQCRKVRAYSYQSAAHSSRALGIIRVPCNLSPWLLSEGMKTPNPPRLSLLLLISVFVASILHPQLVKSRHSSAKAS